MGIEALCLHPYSALLCFVGIVDLNKCAGYMQDHPMQSVSFGCSQDNANQ